jgi:hypothetical protein
MNPSKSAIAKYGEDRRLNDEDMIANLEERCKRKDRDNVEEEELDNHPLLAATSVMHYLSAPRGPEDLPGFEQRLANASRLLGKASAEVPPGRGPFLFDAPKYVLAASGFEHMWRGREAFADMVVTHANLDVFGYWYRDALSLAQELLCGLAVNTRGGMMLSEEEGINHTVIFRYAEISDKTSRFWKVCGVLAQQFMVPTFFLHNFIPAHLERLLKLFPSAHFVGLTCPAVDVEQQCLAILKARKSGSQTASVEQAPRRDKYGNVLPFSAGDEIAEAWLNGDTPAGTMQKPTAMGKRNEKK